MFVLLSPLIRCMGEKSAVDYIRVSAGQTHMDNSNNAITDNHV